LEEGANVIAVGCFADDCAFIEVRQTKDLIEGIGLSGFGDNQTFPGSLLNAAIGFRREFVGGVVYLRGVGSTVVRQGRDDGVTFGGVLFDLDGCRLTDTGYVEKFLKVFPTAGLTGIRKIEHTAVKEVDRV